MNHNDVHVKIDVIGTLAAVGEDLCKPFSGVL